jgi:hypothetical protein
MSFLKIVENMMSMESAGLTADNVDIQYEVHEVVHKQFLKLGISEQAIKVAKRAVDASISTVKKNNDLRGLLAKMMNKGPWLYEHSLMLSFITSMIVEQLDWKSDDTLYKVHLAAFFMISPSPQSTMIMTWSNLLMS